LSFPGYDKIRGRKTLIHKQQLTRERPARGGEEDGNAGGARRIKCLANDILSFTDSARSDFKMRSHHGQREEPDCYDYLS
jgi:hypothetical protein